MNCPTCIGKGKIYQKDSNPETCSVCKGAGKVHIEGRMKDGSYLYVPLQKRKNLWLYYLLFVVFLMAILYYYLPILVALAANTLYLNILFMGFLCFIGLSILYFRWFKYH